MVAELAGGATVLREVRADGPALAVRRTGTGRGGPAQVHLVGTAAGPMGGDEVTVRIRVGQGARLVVAGVAASVVLPGRDQVRSALRLDVEAGAGAELCCTLPPVVVTGRAEHEATTVVRLAGDARLVLSESVRLGRHEEPGGWWRGRTDVTRDGAPLLRQTTTLGQEVRDATRDGPCDGLDDGSREGLRALTSVLDTAGRQGGSAGEATVVMPLAAGGTLTTTVG